MGIPQPLKKLTILIFILITSTVSPNLTFLQETPPSHSLNDESINETQIDITAIGHKIIRGDEYNNPSLLNQHFSEYQIIQSPSKGFTSIVGVHINKKTLLITFKGTELNVEDILADMKFFKDSIKGPNSCGDQIEVMTGFLGGYNQLKYEIFEAIRKYTLVNDFTQIIFTGHSLGASMTSIAALEYLKARELKHEGFMIPKVSLITFGTPRVGTQIFTECLNARLYHNFRIFNGKDPVPAVPPMALYYVHTGTFIQFEDYEDEMPYLGPKNADAYREYSYFKVSDHLNYFMIDSKAVWKSIHDEKYVKKDNM